MFLILKNKTSLSVSACEGGGGGMTPFMRARLALGGSGERKETPVSVFYPQLYTTTVVGKCVWGHGAQSAKLAWAARYLKSRALNS